MCRLWSGKEQQFEPALCDRMGFLISFQTNPLFGAKHFIVLGRHVHIMSCLVVSIAKYSNSPMFEETDGSFDRPQCFFVFFNSFFILISVFGSLLVRVFVYTFACLLVQLCVTVFLSVYILTIAPLVSKLYSTTGFY